MPRQGEPLDHALLKRVRFGRHLREVRERKNISQRQLAVPGATPAYISRIEKGDRYPSGDVKRRLASRLEVSVFYLETGIEQPPLEEQSDWVEWFAQSDTCQEVARAMPHGDALLVAAATWESLWDEFGE